MPKTNAPKNEKSAATLIANIYAYLVLAIGVSVLAVGAYQLVRNITGRVLLEKYPIGYEESRCDMFMQPYYPGGEVMPYPTGSPVTNPEEQQKKIEQQNKKAKDECMVQLDELRARKAKTDFYEAISLVLVGALLTVPHAVFAYRLKR